MISARTSQARLNVLLRMYVPMMLAACLFLGLVVAVPCALIWLPSALFVPPLIMAVCGLHFFAIVQNAKHRPRQGPDWFELRLDFDKKVKLHEFVVDIARRWDLPRPNDVRLSAASTAHVYETEKGKRILVIGGLAMAALTQEGLSAVVAHELMHFDAGDTTFTWDNMTGIKIMDRLAFDLRTQFLHYLNPAMWVLAPYHLFVEWYYAARSRDGEFEADARAAEHAGPVAAGAALIYVHLVDHMEWAKLENVVEFYVNIDHMGAPIFTEQVRRAQRMSDEDWRKALDRELKRGTGLLASHPCLADRLRAIGAKPKDALAFLLDSKSGSAKKLIADWADVEKKLSIKLTSVFAAYRDARHAAYRV